MKVHDEIARSEAFGLRRHQQWGHNNGAMPHGEESCVQNIAACSETAQAKSPKSKLQYLKELKDAGFILTPDFNKSKDKIMAAWLA